MAPTRKAAELYSIQRKRLGTISGSAALPNDYLLNSQRLIANPWQRISAENLRDPTDHSSTRALGIRHATNLIELFRDG